MPPIIEDVKTYVDLKPVHAWGSSKDVKLSARSLTHYTLAEPTRKEVFKSNYTRRLNQRNAQGYFSAPWRPYQEVGKPLYLDLKTIVKTGLLQDSEASKNAKLEREDSNGSENVEQFKGQNNKGRRMSTISFLMQHRRHKDLQDISKYLTNVNDTKTTVRKGRSLFKVLEEAKSEREKAIIKEKAKDLQDKRKGIGSDDNASSSSQDVNNQANMMKAYQEKKQATQQRKMSMKTLTRPMSSPVISMTKIEDEESSILTVQKAKKKKLIGEQVPPYTPVHGPNIMKINVYKKFSMDDEESLRKELCVLHWLIEACNLEAMSRLGLTNYIPLMQCWESVTKPGGRILDPGSRIKKPGLWNQFLRNSLNKSPRRYRRAMSRHSLIKKSPSFADMQSSLSLPRNPSSPRLSARSYQSVVPPSPMSAMAPASADLDNSDNRPSSPTPSSVTTTAYGPGTVTGSEIDDDTFTIQSSHVEDDDVGQYHINLQKLLSTVKESVDKEMKLREAAVDAKATISGRQRPPVYIWAKQLYIEEMNRNKSEEKVDFDKRQRRPTLKKQTSIKVRPHTAAPKKVAMHPSVEYSYAARPKSSPAKLMLGYETMSVRRERMPEEMREKFREITDTKALQLHNQLGEMGRKQLERMETKFKSLQRPQSSMHRDLHNMRVTAMEESQNKKDNLTFDEASQTTEWYVILLQNLPKNCDFTKEILQRIKLLAAKAAGWEEQQEAEYDHRKFLRSNSSQQDMAERGRSSVRSTTKKLKDVEITAEIFLGVLNTLRVWELCAPEVSAAVEFVREFVVGMPPQQYEEWRSERIQREKSRPMSAPFISR